MYIPDSIKIGANEITIKRVPTYEIDSDDNGGAALWERNIMQVANDMPEDRTAVTFIHEILHFINIYLEEKEATFVSEGLIQVIRDNNLDFRKPK